MADYICNVLLADFDVNLGFVFLAIRALLVDQWWPTRDVGFDRDLMLRLQRRLNVSIDMRWVAP